VIRHGLGTVSYSIIHNPRCLWSCNRHFLNKIKSVSCISTINLTRSL